MADARLKRGDLLPRVVLPDPGGTAVDLSHQSIAGAPILLWVVADGDMAANAPRLAALPEDFAAVEANVFAVVSGEETALSDVIEGRDSPISSIPRAASRARSACPAAAGWC